MLQSLKKVVGHKIIAADGKLGVVDDFYFDDQTWVIRYIVVDTGNWLSGRRVLINPGVASEPNWDTQSMAVALTQEQVKESPGINTALPVSRQEESQLFEHYGWTPYWGAMGTFMTPPPPTQSARPLVPAVDVDDAEAPRVFNHLHSLNEVTGYNVQGSDDNVGHVSDFIGDTAIWFIRYVVVDTRHWLPGRKVLVSPQWVRQVNWDDRDVKVDLSREAVKDSPEFNPAEPVNRAYEAVLHDYYGRPVYWPR